MGKLNYEKVKYFIEIKSDSGCKLLSKEYLRNDENLIIKCKCGNEFITTYSNFVYNKKRQCNECGLEIKKQKFTKNYSDIKIFIEKEIKEWKVLKLLSFDYKNSHTKLIIQDSEGYKYYLSYSTIYANYINKRNIDRFNTNNPYTIYNIKLWLKLKNINYELLSDIYTNAKENNLLWKCPNNHIFSMSWNNFMKGKRCGECLDSKGEARIKEYLTKNNISFKREFKIKECKNKKILPFDFAIFNDNNKTILKLLIEYDGEQHYNKTGWDTKNDNKLLRTKKNDEIRNNYCKNNNIKLLRIPYWEYDNIEKILENELNKVERGEIVECAS